MHFADLVRGFYMCDKYSINNRRYLGNKFKLLSTIKEVVEENCEEVKVVVDIFAGTGVVASAFRDKTIITNDLLYSNYICNYAWFGSEKYSLRKVKSLIKRYNSLTEVDDNYMSENFSGKYFSDFDCRKIGYIREDIERLFAAGEINFREKAVLITSLLYSMDRIANTCGHYDAFIRGAELKDSLFLKPLDAPARNRKSNTCYNMDANALAEIIQSDLVYIDPPYNSRQYCDAYHLLENVALWQKPELEGVAMKMDRTGLKSSYCTKSAPLVMSDLIKSLDTKYILVSYNNMANKGNARSNARITDDELLAALEAKGEVTVFSQDYKAFTTGKSDIKDNQERLFLCKVRR